MDGQTIIFEDWQSALDGVPAERRRAYREAIAKFRYWLRETGKPATPETFKTHLDWKKSYLPAERFALRQEALRWYYAEGLKRMRSASRSTAQGKALRTSARSPAPRPPTSAGTGSKGNAGPNRLGEYRAYEMNDVPPAGKADIGGPPWEQALVRRLREKGLAWTSEKT